MEVFFTCGMAGMLALGALVVVLFARQSFRLRTLEGLVEKLSRRVAAQETPAATRAAEPTAPGPPPLPGNLPSGTASPPFVRQSGRAAIDWEAFMGVKLFAWLGGFVLFLTFVFLVRYAFENNLITPVRRIALGVLSGIGLIAGGWFTALRRHRALGQSLGATGVLVLYASIFSAHTYYSLISLWTAFAFMAGITLVAFWLALLLDAQAVVVLGLVGGFLTPPLLEDGTMQPALVFGYVALMNLGIAAVAWRRKWDYLVLLAVCGTVATEMGWLPAGDAQGPALPVLGWFVGLFLFLAAYPFFTARGEGTWPWAVGALAGVLHYWPVDAVVAADFPGFRNGLLPALFVLPYLLGVLVLVRQRGAVPASGDARLAWQGGAALFFISLIFPIQFEREWITLGWALEGFTLLALYRAVPHRGLRWAGAGLLSAAFARLALNPAVLDYHPRSGVRIWNWYLYAYGTTSLCLLGGARVGRPWDATPAGRVVLRFLGGLGGVLVFLLLNIEIADFFSVGPTLTFSFEGNFARDMIYSIAWSLFAFVLLLIGMREKARWVRYAGLALVLVTLAKLFLHDFANLGPLYRIGAFLGMAVILIGASFVYQLFLAPAKKVSDG